MPRARVIRARSGIPNKKIWNLALLTFACAALAIPISTSAADVCCTCQNEDPTKDYCFTTDAAKLLKANDCSSLPVVAKMPDGWTCDAAVLQTNDPKCASIPNNGVCQSDPKSALSLSSEAVGIKTNAKPLPDIPFSLGVPIPGFTAPEDITDLFSTYLVAIFRYLLSIVAVVTTIMFIYGAFRYLVGSSLGSVSRGKEIMVDSVIGLLLMLSATMILRTVNPALTTLKSLAPMEIETQLTGNYRNDVIPPQGALSRTGYKPPNAEEMILTGARLVPGINPCVILALCQIESSLRQQWNGQYAGNPKEKAHAFGPCQQEVQFVHGASPYAKAASKLFSDFPLGVSTDAGNMTKEEKLRVGDWLISNYIGAGYIAALNFRSGLGSQNNNEVAALATYYGGAGSLKNWKTAHGCTPTAGVKLSSGIPGNMEKDACIPEYVAVALPGNPAAACPKDGYICPSVQDKTSQFVGTCSDGTPCKAAQVGVYARNIVKAYQGVAAKYDCTPGTGNATQLAAALQKQGQTTPASSGKLKTGVSVLLIGDSLSVGLASRLGSDVRKTGASFSGIGEEGTFINQWARGGRKNASLTQALAAHPTIVIISLGTNDEYLSTAAGRAESDELDALVSQIKSAGATIYWVGPPPLPSTYNGNHPSGVVIPMIAAAASSQGFNFFPGDQLNIPRQSIDKLHPTPEGYATWADLIFNWLQSS